MPGVKLGLVIRSLKIGTLTKREGNKILNWTKKSSNIWKLCESL